MDLNQTVVSDVTVTWFSSELIFFLLREMHQQFDNTWPKYSARTDDVS